MWFKPQKCKGIKEALFPIVALHLPSSCVAPEIFVNVCTSQYKDYSFPFLHKRIYNIPKRIMYHTHCSAPFFLHES